MKTYAQMTKAALLQRIAELEKRQTAGATAFAHERIAHELQVHQAGQETQNHELQQSRQLLEDSRDRYADLYDFAPVGLLTLDRRGTIRAINLTACAMLGAGRTRLEGQPFHTHVAESDRAKLRPHLLPRAQPGARVETELQLVWKGRPTIVLNVQSVLVGDDDNGDFRCGVALTDITAYRRAEAALRESELQQRLALEGADLGLWDWNFPTGHFAVNERWCAMLGHAPREIEPHIQSWRDRVHPDDLPAAHAAWTAHCDGQTASYQAEYRLRHKNGGWVWILDKGRVIERAAGGQPIRVCGTHLDITERKMAEAALRLSEERFRQMAGAINQVFWMTTVDKNEMLYVSPAYERIWGRTCASLYAAPRTWLDAIHPEDRAGLIAAATTQQAAGTYDVEYRILRLDGTERWIRDRAFPIGDGSGAVHGIAGLAEDITERRRLQAELIKISDDVQQRIGQDLHDDICQQLAGIAFRLECLQGDVEESSTTHREIGEISTLLRGATVAARTMSHTLSPVSVEPGGLSDALEGLAARSASLFGIPVDFICAQPVAASDAVAAGHLYRIAQEAITNARNHGKARRIRVTLAAAPGGGSLIIADNGCGCALPIQGKGGMGLRIMQYRAGLIGATLRLAPTKGGGLTIRCAFRPHTPTP